MALSTTVTTTMPGEVTNPHSLQARKVARERASGEIISIAELPANASIVNVLGVDYVHTSAKAVGDLYLTTAGYSYAEHLQPENWFEPSWFQAKRERLQGSGLVYSLPTKPVHGESLSLVVKFSRVGEKVPIDTELIENLLCCEFNGPFEEFGLVEELRHRRRVRSKGEGLTRPDAGAGGSSRDQHTRSGTDGRDDFQIRTQLPLAIYVPPEETQPVHSGRFQWRIARKVAQHPGVAIDIMRQYIVVYRWLPGVDAWQAKTMGLLSEDEALKLTDRATEEMRVAGFRVLDMKPEHVIIEPSETGGVVRESGRIQYGLVDFELLERTAEYYQELQSARRENYERRRRELVSEDAGVGGGTDRGADGKVDSVADGGADRGEDAKVEAGAGAEAGAAPGADIGPEVRAAVLPANLTAASILGVDYVHGRAESTGGMLWVVGASPDLFDYFLPERWRTTPQIRLLEGHETYFTTSKDNVRFVWKVSRVGEPPEVAAFGADGFRVLAHGFNSPFEEVAIAWWLSHRGIPTTLPRAVYRTGHRSELDESLFDPSRYRSHSRFRAIDGEQALDTKRNYITIWDYWNGPEIAPVEGAAPVARSVNVAQAVERGLLEPEESLDLAPEFKERLSWLGVDVLRLLPEHILLSIDTEGGLARDEGGRPVSCLCNFQYLRLPTAPEEARGKATGDAPENAGGPASTTGPEDTAD